MKFYNAAMEIGYNEIVVADFDVENPACNGDPFVRVGVVDHWPLTDMEYLKFLTEHEVVGRQSEVFPSGIVGQDDFWDALQYAREQENWKARRMQEIVKGNRTE